jgi:hypothetical protein
MATENINSAEYFNYIKLANQVCEIRQLMAERPAGYMEKDSQNMRSSLPPPLCPLITQHNTNTARLSG